MDDTDAQEIHKALYHAIRAHGVADPPHLMGQLSPSGQLAIMYDDRYRIVTALTALRAGHTTPLRMLGYLLDVGRARALAEIEYGVGSC